MNMAMYRQVFLCNAASTHLIFVVLLALSHKIDDDDDDDDGSDSSLFVMPTDDNES